MKLANSTWIAVCVVSLAVTAGTNRPAGAAGTLGATRCGRDSRRPGRAAAGGCEPRFARILPAFPSAGRSPERTGFRYWRAAVRARCEAARLWIPLLPEGLIYRLYLAGPKEPRMAAGIVSIPDDSTLWDATIGGRLGMFRFGNSDPIRPRGFQMDVEAAAMLRLDIPENVDVRTADYRVGFPLTWGNEFSQWKFSYYHMSSHLGDEFWEENPEFPLFRQARDALVLGPLAVPDRFPADLRRGGLGLLLRRQRTLGGPVRLGCAPRVATGLHGVPFVAINGYLREELDFGGGMNLQAGWAWRSDTTAHLLRFVFQYYNGASPQYAFLPFHESQYGLILWYDF